MTLKDVFGYVADAILAVIASELYRWYSAGKEHANKSRAENAATIATLPVSYIVSYVAVMLGYMLLFLSFALAGVVFLCAEYVRSPHYNFYKLLEVAIAVYSANGARGILSDLSALFKATSRQEIEKVRRGGQESEGSRGLDDDMRAQR
jgi:membrane protein required for beta-lactamase induction